MSLVLIQSNTHVITDRPFGQVKANGETKLPRRFGGEPGINRASAVGPIRTNTSVGHVPVACDRSHRNYQKILFSDMTEFFQTVFDDDLIFPSVAYISRCLSASFQLEFIHQTAA